MNPNFNEIGNAFVTHYYKLFDNKDTRAQIGALYNAEAALMTFEDTQIMGIQKIMEKVQNQPLDNMMRALSKIDCQPMANGGILVTVIGQLKNQSEHDKAMSFCQTFVLSPTPAGSFCITNDIFRLVLHDM